MYSIVSQLISHLNSLTASTYVTAIFCSLSLNSVIEYRLWVKLTVNTSEMIVHNMCRMDGGTTA